MLATEQAVPFTESFKYPGARQTITFTASSYTQWVHSIFPQLQGCEPISHEQAHELAHNVGRFWFFYRIMPMEEWRQAFLFSKPRLVRSSLQIYKRTTAAYCNFDAPVGIPILCERNRDPNLMQPWMSLTPNEVLTQRGQVRRARGKVAMAGLGLGWAARRVLERSAVEHLTVVDIDEAVLKYFGEPLQAEFPGKLTLVQGNAYTAIDWQAYDVALWDIWPGYGDAGWDNHYQAIKQSLTHQGKVCVAWGDLGTNY